MTLANKCQEQIPSQDNSRVIEVLGDVGYDLTQQWSGLNRSDREQVGSFCEALDEAVFSVAKRVYLEQITRTLLVFAHQTQTNSELLPMSNSNCLRR